MPATKRTSIFAVAAVLTAAALFYLALTNIHYFSPPRLVIKFDGNPAANAILILPTSNTAPSKLDPSGGITSPTPSTETAILVSKPSGGAVSSRFPKHGTKTVDIRGRMTMITVVQYFGLVRTQNQQNTLTQDEVAGIESGQNQLADIEDKIRRSN
jgi:hypothetical protein